MDDTVESLPPLDLDGENLDGEYMFAVFGLSFLLLLVLLEIYMKKEVVCLLVLLAMDATVPNTSN